MLAMCHSCFLSKDFTNINQFKINTNIMRQVLLLFHLTNNSVEVKGQITGQSPLSSKWRSHYQKQNVTQSMLLLCRHSPPALVICKKGTVTQPHPIHSAKLSFFLFPILIFTTSEVLKQYSIFIITHFINFSIPRILFPQRQ